MSKLISKSLDLFGLGSSKKRKPSEVPTLDQARENQIEADRLRKRRGNFGNIFGGALNQSPTTSYKTLLGQ